MPKRKRTNRRYGIEDLSPERQREIIYHEAGHAVALLLYSELQDLKMISLRSTETFLSRVRQTTPWVLPQLVAAWPRDVMDPTNGRTITFRMAHQTKAIFSDLAGPCAENICSTDLVEDWLSSSMDKSPDGPTDYDSAWTLAKIDADDLTAMAVLRRAADWIDKVMKEPRVWRVVDALAMSLRPGRDMSGTKAWRIMEKAWGPYQVFPAIRELGPVWEEHLHWTDLTRPAESPKRRRR